MSSALRQSRGDDTIYAAEPHVIIYIATIYVFCFAAEPQMNTATERRAMICISDNIRPRGRCTVDVRCHALRQSRKIDTDVDVTSSAGLYDIS